MNELKMLAATRVKDGETAMPFKLDTELRGTVRKPRENTLENAQPRV